MAYLPRRQRRRDSRPSAAKRHYGAHHRHWRKLVLARHPICQDCGRAPSTDAHHIVALRKGGTWDVDTNAMGLCHPCHSLRTQRGE
jgi:5-methylcytosine-specific restriction protein A